MKSRSELSEGYNLVAESQVRNKANFVSLDRHQLFCINDDIFMCDTAMNELYISLLKYDWGSEIWIIYWYGGWIIY